MPVTRKDRSKLQNKSARKQGRVARGDYLLRRIASGAVRVSKADRGVKNGGRFIRYGITELGDSVAVVLEDGVGIVSIEPGYCVREQAAEAMRERVSKEFEGKSLVRDDTFAKCLVGGFCDSGYFPGVTLRVRATAFELSVWKALMAVKCGTTVSYAELAQKAGKPRSYARAVARVVASNRVALLMPCHRVLPSSGGVGRYRWGAPLKKQLLEAEKLHI